MRQRLAVPKPRKHGERSPARTLHLRSVMTRRHRSSEDSKKQQVRPAAPRATPEELSRFESEGGPPERELESPKAPERSPRRKSDRADG